MSIDINEIRTRYKDLFEHSLDIIYVNRLDGKIIDANDIALSTLGYKREEIIDFSFGDLIDKDQLENANSAFKEIKETGQQSKLFEFRLKAKDGSFVYIETYAIPLQKNGKIYATLGIARNITDLRVVQENLKQSEEKYRFLYETTPFSVVLLNSDGIIVDCNSTAETMFGFNKIELIGRHFKNISVIHQDYLPELFNLFQRIIKGEKLHRIDIQVYKKDGSLIWIIFRASLIKIDKENYIQVILYDIAERKLLEKELKEINQLKSEILERTSHELKTPLISIKGFTDLLLDLHKEKFDAETVSILDEIKQGTEQLQTIINKLLETSYLESGKVQFNPIEDDLSFLVKFCVKNLRGLANTRKHFISLDMPEKLIVKFEKEKLYEVVSHLIINAIKYTPPYGEIKIQSEIDGAFTIVSVKDNGIGITKEEHKKIFKQFGKIERYGQGWDIGIEGTGMGLYTSKKIVELHGGKIWVESEGRNMGSKFSFSLPYNKE